MGPVDVVVIVSPHGKEAIVYQEVSGSLDEFGIRGSDCTRPTDDGAAKELAAAWGAAIEDGPVDHGVIVPLLSANLPDAPVVACATGEMTGPTAGSIGSAVDAGRGLASAVVELARERSVALIASANTSAGLSPAAPLGQRAQGRELDEAILGAVSTDPSQLAAIPPWLWDEGGSCGAAPLTVFALVFAGRPVERLHYSHPAGVGYLVAATQQ